MSSTCHQAMIRYSFAMRLLLRRLAHRCVTRLGQNNKNRIANSIHATPTHADVENVITAFPSILFLRFPRIVNCLLAGAIVGCVAAHASTFVGINAVPSASAGLNGSLITHDDTDSLSYSYADLIGR